jgi:Protein of unknown function, DUF255
MSAGQHPYFTSGLRWHTQLADGLADAGARGLKVFLAHGHRFCGGTRALVERTLAKEEVAEMMERHFVCVASDGEQLTPEVAALIEQLPKKEPTPLCLYLDAAGTLLASTAGGRPPAVLLNDMLNANSRR